MRIYGILKRGIKAFKVYYINCKQFGAKAAFWICVKYVVPSYRGEKGMNFLANWFDKKLRWLVEEYKYQKDANFNKKLFDKIPIWVCWLTGLDDRPELVRICNDSIERNCPEIAEVRYITLENYQEYIDIPGIIKKKYQDGKIGPAHFSDVIRFCLLSKYGGMWLDATVYVTDLIPDKYLCSSYFTQKVMDKNKYKNEPSRAQWCGFIWSGWANNILFCFVRDALFWYWENYDSAIDYIFFDYIIKTAYNRLENIRIMMDGQEPNNEEIWALSKILEKEYNEDKFMRICLSNIFHKLSYQKKYISKTYQNKLTFWGYLKSKSGK